MKIITCASYYATGSSAVTDLFSEFINCSSPGNYEFRFIHDPDGIRDLEYNLLENSNRHNTSNAIKRYLKYAKFLNGNYFRKCYSKYMGKDVFLKYTKEFIDQITELQCDSWWHYDQQMGRSELFYWIDYAWNKLCHLVMGKKARTWRYSLLELLHEQGYFCAINQETFYRYVREYTRKVIGALNKKDTEFIMVDQLMPPSNIYQYLNYFDDIKVVVTERDPRDLFIEVMRAGEKVIPHDNVEEFCKWYQITRRHRKTEIYDPEKVYFLQFEDLIYRYEETTAKLIKFVGMDLEDHIYPLTYLKPEVSIKNTNLKLRYPMYSKEVEYIEKTLGEYLYEFLGIKQKN